MRRTVPAVLAAVVVLAGCTADPVGPSEAPAAPGVVESEPPPPAEPTSTPAPAHPVMLAAIATPAVAGEDYEVLVTWPGGSPGAGTRRPEVLLPNGSAIGVEEPPGHLVHDVFTAPARVGVMTGDGFAPFQDTSGTLPEHGFRGVGEVAHRDGVTVWTEAHSVQGWGAWRLFVHDDAGTRLVTTAETVAAALPEFEREGAWDLRVHDGRVSWSSGGSELSVALDDTDLRIDPLPDAAGPEGVEVLVRADGGVDLAMTGPDGPVAIREEAAVVDVVACGDRVGWSARVEEEATITVTYDRSTGTLWRIDEPHQVGRLMCAGDLLAYQQLDPDSGLTASTTVIRWPAG